MNRLDGSDPDIGNPVRRWEVTPTREPVHQPDAPFEPTPPAPTKVPEKVP
jgi:hypothetical protein